MDFTYDDYLKLVLNGGFLVPKLELEIPLYRYRSNIDYIVDEIENDRIYMAPLEKLNDPFDSSCAIEYEEACQLTKPIMDFYYGAYFLEKAPFYAEFKSFINELPNESVTLFRFSEIVSDFAKKRNFNIRPDSISRMYFQRCFHKPKQQKVLGRVASFSETWKSIPMWSYYANSHKGVCMKYDFSLLDKEDVANKNICNSLRKVWYSEQRFADSKGQFTPFVKSLQWAHEQEWRLFRELDESYVYMPCLTEIYLGINFDFCDINRIQTAVQQNRRNINVYLVHPKPNVYEFECIPVRFN